MGTVRPEMSIEDRFFNTPSLDHKKYIQGSRSGYFWLTMPNPNMPMGGMPQF